MKTDFKVCADTLLEIALRGTGKTSIHFFGNTFYVGSFREGEFQYIYGHLTRFFETCLWMFDQDKYLDIDMIKNNIRPVRDQVSSVSGITGNFGDLDTFHSQECMHANVYEEIVRLIDRILQATLMEAKISKYESALRVVAKSAAEMHGALGKL